MTLLQNGRRYFDWNASALLCENSRKSLISNLDLIGNASSVHYEGREARNIIETSRDDVEGNVFEKTEQLTNSPCSVTQSLFSSGSRRELLSECTPDESMRAISQVAKAVKEVKATNRRVRATNRRVIATNRRVRATNRRVRATKATKATKSPETSRYEVGGNEFEKAKPLDNRPCSVTQSLFASDEFLSDLEKSFRDAGTNHTFTSSNLQEELMHVNGTPRTKTRYKVSFDVKNSPMMFLLAHFLIKNKM